MNHLKTRLLCLSLPYSDIAPSRNTSKGTENLIGISGKLYDYQAKLSPMDLIRKKKNTFRTHYCKAKHYQPTINTEKKITRNRGKGVVKYRTK